MKFIPCFIAISGTKDSFVIPGWVLVSRIYIKPFFVTLKSDLVTPLHFRTLWALRAIFLIPRHFFIHPDFKDFAYRDEAFPIDENQTISQH